MNPEYAFASAIGTGELDVSDRLHGDETRHGTCQSYCSLSAGPNFAGYLRERISSNSATVRFRTLNRERSRPSHVSVLSATRG